MLESINPLHLNSNAPKGSNLTQALNDSAERSHILSVYWCCASVLNMWLVIGHCWLWNWRLTVVICNLAFVYIFYFEHVTSFCNFSIHHKVGEGDWAAMQEETYQTSWDMMLCVSLCVSLCVTLRVWVVKVVCGVPLCRTCYSWHHWNCNILRFFGFPYQSSIYVLAVCFPDLRETSGNYTL